MNSIFNQSSTVLRSLARDELIQWIEMEGLSNMPPIIKVLVEHVRENARQIGDLQAEIDRLEEENSDSGNAWSDARENGADAADECVHGLAEKLDGMLDELDGAYEVLLPNGARIEPRDLKEDSPWDTLVFRRSDFDSFREDCDELKESLERFEAGEYFKDPS